MSDNVPLLSWWLLRGRCRTCRVPFSMRYFWVELLTGLVLAGLYFLEGGLNIHGLAIWHKRLEAGRFQLPPIAAESSCVTLTGMQLVLILGKAHRQNRRSAFAEIKQG